LVIAFSRRRSIGRRMDRVRCCSGVASHFCRRQGIAAVSPCTFAGGGRIAFFAVSSENTVLADMATAALGTGPSQTRAAVVAARTQNCVP
jgi:hypothetical protein